MSNEIKGLSRTDLFLEKGVQKVIVVSESSVTDADKVTALEQRVTDLEQTIDTLLTEVFPNIVR